MNKYQRQHMASVLSRFIPEWTAKYRKGTIEHKTNLDEDFNIRQVFNMLKEEVQDLVSYTYTIESKLDDMENYIKYLEKEAGIGK